MPTKAKKPVKKVATKKVAHKKAPVAVAHKTTVRTTKAPVVRSFRPSRPVDPFFTFRITHQTFYWLILAVLVVALAVWVTVISARVQNIYDQINTTNAQSLGAPYPVHSMQKQ